MAKGWDVVFRREPAQEDPLGSVTGSLGGDTGSLAVGAGVAAAVFAAQNGLIQVPGL